MRAELSAAQDQLFTAFAWAACLAALGQDAGLTDRMPSTVASALTAAQGMIDRVHRLGAGVGTNAHVPAAARFADAHVDPIQVPQLSDGSAAGTADAAYLTGWQY